MRRLSLLVVVAISLQLHAAPSSDWTAPLAPFRIGDNLYYVGSRDLASYLITTRAGNILNANLASSPPQIRASVEKLGFRWADTRIFLNSQAHFDHVGGAAEVLRETHARNLVMEGDAEVMSTGGHSDFAYGSDITTTFKPTHVDQVLHDGSAITLGGVTVIAHKTAGHTRGCTTFTLRVHLPEEPPTRFRSVVIVGGLAALPHYRLVGAPGDPASYPGIAGDFEHTFAALRALPCDIALGAHGAYFNMLPKLARMSSEGAAVFIDPAGYQALIAKSQRDFQAILLSQRRSRQ